MLYELGPEELQTRAELQARGYNWRALCAEIDAVGWIVTLWIPPAHYASNGRPVDRGCGVRIFKAPPMRPRRHGEFPRPRAAGDLVAACAARETSERALDKLAVGLRAELQVNGWLEPLSTD